MDINDKLIYVVLLEYIHFKILQARYMVKNGKYNEKTENHDQWTRYLCHKSGAETGTQEGDQHVYRKPEVRDIRLLIIPMR